MQLLSPIIITSRLLPGMKIGDGTIFIDYDCQEFDGITRYKVYIDLPNFEYEETELKSGCQGGSLQEGLGSLLSFLGACAESYDYERRTGRESENVDLFPVEIAEWCYQNSDEISMLGFEIEETETELIVE